MIDFSMCVCIIVINNVIKIRHNPMLNPNIKFEKLP